MNRQKISIQIDLIEEAMKNAGVWSEDVPDWIREYQEGPVVNIWQWLQFIQLPMRLNESLKQPQYLAPQLRHYINGESLHRHILQLVIELDSITSTIARP